MADECGKKTSSEASVEANLGNAHWLNPGSQTAHLSWCDMLEADPSGAFHHRRIGLMEALVANGGNWERALAADRLNEISADGK